MASRLIDAVHAQSEGRSESSRTGVEKVLLCVGTGICHPGQRSLEHPRAGRLYREPALHAVSIRKQFTPGSGVDASA